MSIANAFQVMLVALGLSIVLTLAASVFAALVPEKKYPEAHGLQSHVFNKR